MLGYDVPLGAAQAGGGERSRRRSDRRAGRASCTSSPISCALAPERRRADDDDERARAPREHFNQYLRSLDAEREGIPTWFVERLERAVAHYGIDDPRRDARARGRADAHLHRPAADATTSSPSSRRSSRRRVAAAPRRCRRPAARCPRPGHRGDPASPPGAGQHRPRGPPSALRPPADRPQPRRRGAARCASTCSPSPVRMPRAHRAAAHEDALIACTLPLTPVFKAGRAVRRDRSTRSAAQRADAPLLQDPRPRPGDSSWLSTASTSPPRSTGATTARRRPRRRGRRPTSSARRSAAVAARRRRRSARHRGRRPLPDDARRRPPDAPTSSPTRLAAASRRGRPAAGDPPRRRDRRPPRRRRGDPAVHVPTGRRGRRGAVLDAGGDRTGRPAALRRGPQVPRPPSDDLPAAADVAAVELRDLPPPVGRRRVRLRLRRQGQPGRPPARRRRRDPRPDPVARRARAGGGHPRGRARPHRMPRRDPQRPGRRPATGATRLEPGDAVHLAGRRPPVRRDQRHRPPAHAAHRGARTRAGRRQRATAAAGVRPSPSTR